MNTEELLPHLRMPKRSECDGRTQVLLTDLRLLRAFEKTVAPQISASLKPLMFQRSKSLVRALQFGKHPLCIVEHVFSEPVYRRKDTLLFEAWIAIDLLPMLHSASPGTSFIITFNAGSGIATELAIYRKFPYVVATVGSLLAKSNPTWRTGGWKPRFSAAVRTETILVQGAVSQTGL